MTTSRTGTITGPLTRTDGTQAWRIRWFDSDGERRSERVTGTRREAERRLDLRLREAEEERVGLRTKPIRSQTLSEVAVRAAKEVLSLTQRPQQIVTTMSRFAIWWEPALGDRQIHTITASDLRGVLAQARQQGRTAGTCNRLLSTISVVFQAAIDWGMISVNPARGLRLREGRKVPRFLSAAEAQRLIDAAEPQWRGVFAMAIYTGMRMGELQALRWSDVDLDSRVVIVRASGTDANAPKSGHERVVPLHEALLPLLPPPAHPTHLVFPGRRSGRLVPADPVNGRMHNPLKALQRALTAAGIHRHLTMHDLRHTFGTLTSAAGVPQRMIQTLLGHSSPAMTARYVHAVGEQGLAVARLRLGGPTPSHGPEGDE